MTQILNNSHQNLPSGFNGVFYNQVAMDRLCH